jgi:hypothetical protein
MPASATICRKFTHCNKMVIMNLLIMEEIPLLFPLFLDNFSLYTEGRDIPPDCTSAKVMGERTVQLQAALHHSTIV